MRRRHRCAGGSERCLLWAGDDWQQQLIHLGL